MKTLYINRFASSELGTRSTVTYNSIEDSLWHGIERPWLDNLPYESCIPTGTYTLLPWNSPRYGEVYIFVGGSVGLTEGDGDRFACLIHPANYPRQLQGCLALGKTHSEYYEKEKSEAVWSSKDALSDFRETMGYEPMQAIIRWVLP